MNGKRKNEDGYMEQKEQRNTHDANLCKNENLCKNKHKKSSSAKMNHTSASFPSGECHKSPDNDNESSQSHRLFEGK